MNTEFNKEQLDKIYPSGIEYHYWNFSRNSILYNQIKKNGLFKKKILDIGCGKGVVTRFLREKDIDCYGVDISEYSSEEEFLFYNQDAFELDNSIKKKIQVILLLDVLEHIENRVLFLDKINKNFPSLEKIIITVPARQELFSNYDTFNNHFLRYNIRTLKKELSLAFFEQASIRYFFHILYLPALLFCALKINRNTNLKAPKSSISKFIHRIISLYFIVEFYIFPKKITGSSIFAIASKKINNG